MAEILLPTVHCYRCGKSWTPRRASVRMCPGCKSRLFETPRRPSRAAMVRLRRLLEREPPPSFDDIGRVRFDMRRRREKDELLAKHRMRPSLSYGSKGV